MKKIGLICLALVMALGALGVGYAAWTDTVTIEQTVMTGTVCVGIRDIGTDDDPGNADAVSNPGWDGAISKDPGLKDGEPFQYDKDVASALSENIETKCLHDTDQFYVKVKETITNAYPGYAPTMTVEIANCGSIPVIISAVEEHHTVQCPMLFHVQIAYYSLSGPASIPTPIIGAGWLALVDALVGIQIDPCEVLTVVVTKHIAQEAFGPEYALDPNNDDLVPCPQNCTCWWEETIHFVQWNKY